MGSKRIHPGPSAGRRKRKNLVLYAVGEGDLDAEK